MGKFGRFPGLLKICCPVKNVPKIFAIPVGCWTKISNGLLYFQDFRWIACADNLHKRVFENKSLIKNRKSFWVPSFDRKRRRLSKLFGKSFTKNLYNFSVLSSLT
ncbi:hypothetical protein, partial [Novacetimonas hansenii]|uniref:hypothetical protein n=1 Tax=Novacetimonas hansenii TaxID=436 RepID=UPI0039EAE799